MVGDVNRVASVSAGVGGKGQNFAYVRCLFVFFNGRVHAFFCV